MSDCAGMLKSVAYEFLPQRRLSITLLFQDDPCFCTNSGDCILEVESRCTVQLLYGKVALEGESQCRARSEQSLKGFTCR